MVTGGIDAVELVLKVLLECEAGLNTEEREIDIQELRETTDNFLKEYKWNSKKLARIIDEAINQFEDLRKMGDENWKTFINLVPY